MPLFPFQRAGSAHLQGGRVRLLADEMGLGKTIQAIDASEDEPDRPVTVICPAILAAEWRDAYAQFGDVPRSVAVIGEKRGPDPATADVVISSYDRAAKGAVPKRSGARLIVDEAHYIKDPLNLRTQAVLGADLPALGGVAASASRVSFLTGTPAPNNAAELYAMLAAGGRYSGSYWQWANDVCEIRETRHGPMPTGLKDVDKVRSALAGFMLRRTSAVELPPTDSGEIIVSPGECADVRALMRYDAAAAPTVAAAAAIEDFSELDTPHMSTMRRLVGLAKAEPVAEMALELLTADPTAKLVLFGIHTDVLNMLRDSLDIFGVVKLAGGETDVARKRAKDRFQSDPQTRVAVCQMRAAGTGLTLTAANHLWLVEPSWTPADNDQAIKRIVRIGQTRRTSVKYVTLDTSIDKAVNAVLRRKRNFIDRFID